MRFSGFKLLGICMLCTLFLIPQAMAFELGDTTPSWSMWDGLQDVNYELYDYRGKLILVDLFATW